MIIAHSGEPRTEAERLRDEIKRLRDKITELEAENHNLTCKNLWLWKELLHCPLEREEEGMEEEESDKDEREIVP